MHRRCPCSVGWRLRGLGRLRGPRGLRWLRGVRLLRRLLLRRSRLQLLLLVLLMRAPRGRPQTPWHWARQSRPRDVGLGSRIWHHHVAVGRVQHVLEMAGAIIKLMSPRPPLARGRSGRRGIRFIGERGREEGEAAAD